MTSRVTLSISATFERRPRGENYGDVGQPDWPGQCEGGHDGPQVWAFPAEDSHGPVGVKIEGGKYSVSTSAYQARGGQYAVAPEEAPKHDSRSGDTASKGLSKSPNLIVAQSSRSAFVIQMSMADARPRRASVGGGEQTHEKAFYSGPGKTPTCDSRLDGHRSSWGVRRPTRSSDYLHPEFGRAAGRRRLFIPSENIEAVEDPSRVLVSRDAIRSITVALFARTGDGVIVGAEEHRAHAGQRYPADPIPGFVSLAPEVMQKSKGGIEEREWRRKRNVNRVSGGFKTRTGGGSGRAGNGLSHPVESYAARHQPCPSPAPGVRPTPTGRVVCRNRDTPKHVVGRVRKSPSRKQAPSTPSGRPVVERRAAGRSCYLIRQARRWDPIVPTFST